MKEAIPWPGTIIGRCSNTKYEGIVRFVHTS